MLAEVPGAARPDPAQAARWVALAREAMAASGQAAPRAELALLVDRAPSVQRIGLMLLRAEGPWEVLAVAPAATGTRGRQGYFVTPTGVFAHDGAILGYRALGTPNAQGIRGLGARGARVWDFGWQPAERGWREDGSEAEIRFLLHATDPALLEPRLGRPGSQGCVRIGGAMNRFLDHHGVLDAELERMAAEDRRAAALLPADRQPTSLAGRLLIVVDSDTRPMARIAGESTPAASCAA
ncbi:L,D-transpeptidase, partial [Roseomonas rosulenta]|uniref:L,D-transpeptidase n=1 Tax=Roseomonas rosulenta TaxID=2748667 RepID=UPI0018DFFABE